MLKRDFSNFGNVNMKWIFINYVSFNMSVIIEKSKYNFLENKLKTTINKQNVLKTTKNHASIKFLLTFWQGGT